LRGIPIRNGRSCDCRIEKKAYSFVHEDERDDGQGGWEEVEGGKIEICLPDQTRWPGGTLAGTILKTKLERKGARQNKKNSLAMQ